MFYIVGMTDNEIGKIAVKKEQAGRQTDMGTRFHSTDLSNLGRSGNVTQDGHWSAGTWGGWDWGCITRMDIGQQGPGEAGLYHKDGQQSAGAWRS